MQDNTYISAQAYGNPTSHGGFMPIAIVNSPAFEVKDTAYSGLAANRYYLAVSIGTTQTIYKLMHNNVSSYGASRPGTLVIAIAIPRGFRMTHGYTPYDALTGLLDQVKKQAMTCRDYSSESYEFKKDLPQHNFLDETARQYTIEPVAMPHRQMSPQGNIACVQAPEERFGDILRDVQYHEFAPYSEIIIAETIDATAAYTRLSVDIPRKPKYTVYQDGKPTGAVSEPYENITAKPTVDPRYFDAAPVTFTVGQLLQGDIIEGVNFDRQAETISVSLAKLVTPKTKTVRLMATPAEADTYLRANPSALTLTCSGRPLALGAGLTFSLTGPDIAKLDSPAAFDARLAGGLYTVRSLIFQGDSLIIDAAKAVINNGKGPHNGETSPVIDIQIANSDKSMFGDRLEIKAAVTDYNGKPLMTQKLQFSHAKGEAHGRYTAHLYLPHNLAPSADAVRLYTNEDDFEAQLPTPLKDTVRLDNTQFKPVGRPALKGVSKKVLLIAGVAAAVLAFLIGGAAGWFAHGYWNGTTGLSTFLPADSADTDSSSIGGAAGVVGATPSGQDNGTVSPEDAKTFMQDTRLLLKEDGLTFGEIDDIYDEFKSHEEQYRAAEVDNADQIARKIKVYKKLRDFIAAGNTDSIKSYVTKVNPEGAYISSPHLYILNKLTKSGFELLPGYKSAYSFTELDKFIGKPQAVHSATRPRANSGNNAGTGSVRGGRNGGGGNGQTDKIGGTSER